MSRSLPVRTALVLLAVLVPLALLLRAASPPGAAVGAPRSDVKPVPGAVVGAVEGTRAYVAVQFDGRRLKAYVCDGDRKGVATIATWLKARWDGRSPLTIARDGVELHVEPVGADGTIRGHVRAFSGPHPFTAAPATGPAGLYDGVDRRRGVRSTWIVRADGSLRGAMVPTRPPRRVCRAVTVALADGTTTQQTRCFDV